jgi:hypothetical protein
VLAAIKRIFVFRFTTALPIDVCRVRLTEDFRSSLARNGEIKGGILSWGIGFENKKGGRIRAISDWYKVTFYYHLSLDPIPEGTLITCRHFPFNPLGLMLWGALSLMHFTASMVSLFRGHFSDAIVMFFIFLFPFTISVLYETFARRPLRDYLSRFLDCTALRD